MAGIDTLNPKHEKYIEKIRAELQANGFIIDDWGMEKIAPQIRDSDIRMDFSMPALRLRGHYDLLVRHRETGFICEIDGKTTMFREDTGKVAVEVWPVLFSRKSEFPRLLVVEMAGNCGLWVDKLEDVWFSTVFMPDRWDDAQRLEFSQHIAELSPKVPYYVYVSWERKKASGDPFYSWPISKVKRVGGNYIVALLKRAVGFKESLF